MPTPVIIARQCLTPESSHALDEAVSVARRRGHNQTTSLHALSALLTLPSSPLRDACARARNSTYSPRLQFKALDLCLSVSLDRVASSPIADDPPVSNSLMAAIKRAQATQRRQPDNNCHVYQQIQTQNQSSLVTCVRVEIRQMILSILDDPIVSRVFAESGFRSTDIKLAIIRPLVPIFKYSRNPIPMFLCNLGDDSDSNSVPNSNITRRSFSFPFSGFSGDENGRRIGEVLLRSRGRNPLLVGVGAYDALQSFTECIQSRKYDTLPIELYGLAIISIESDVLRFVTEDFNEGLMNMRFDEVGKTVERDSGSGLVVNFGDMKMLTMEGDGVAYVVGKLTRLLEIHGGRRVWLIGAAGTYEMYLKFLTRFPSIEKDWDSQLLPITSQTYSSTSRSRLMESFVPFGGFFSTPPEVKTSLTGSYEYAPRCNLCNDKCEQEVTSLSKGVVATASVAYQCQPNLPSWWHMAELGKNKGLDDVDTAKDDGELLSAKVTVVQKKWDNICHRIHQVDSQVQTVVKFQFIKDKNENDHNCSKSNTSPCPSPNGSVRTNLEILSTPKQSKHASFSQSSKGEYGTSLNSATSVTTDLGLGIIKLKKPSRYSSEVDSRNAKMLHKALTEKIGFQDEAISAISQTIARMRTGNETRNGAVPRGDIWLNFLGPDRFIKRKVVVALAEILYQSKENMIHINLNSQEQIKHDRKKFRGKTAVDYIAEELSVKQLSVIYLENVDKADVLVQNSLSHAIKTGKFSDSFGREVNINNATIITSSHFTWSNKAPAFEIPSAKYSEERILRAKGRPIHILVECAPKDSLDLNKCPVFVNKRKVIGRNEILRQPQKLDIAKRANKGLNSNLDLNLPAEEETEVHENDYQNSKAWLEEFFNQVDETVVFKPFDFDAYSEKVSKQINGSFYMISGPECALEVDSTMIDQIVAASCLSDSNAVVDDWIEKVLNKGFEEAKNRYGLTAHSVVKLGYCDDPFLEERAPYLPTKIVIN